jgi:hydrogenase nickel incorporation protein HypB
MCDHCGCSTPKPGSHHHHGHDHDHDHDHHHDHDHAHDDEHRVIALHQNLMAANDRLAERNRGYFMGRGMAVLNLVSSPGSGKTALLERTLQDLSGELKMGTIVGDLATDNDARRLRKSGAPSVQITTGTVCHLDAHMIQHALADLSAPDLQVLFIENVGNLVCPANFDLGEDLRVVVTSVTEGEDKPLKYPSIFQNANIVLLNKVDIADAVGFDRTIALANLQAAAPGARILEVSARTGTGMSAWYEVLRGLVQRKCRPGLAHG